MKKKTGKKKSKSIQKLTLKDLKKFKGGAKKAALFQTFDISGGNTYPDSLPLNDKG